MANNNGQIYIIITDQLPNNPQPVQPSPSNQSAQTGGTGDLLWNYVQHQFFNFVTQQISAEINYSISHMGDYYGQYQAQRDTQAMLGDLSALKNIGLSAFVGGKTGAAAGPWGAVAGAVIGATVATASLILSKERNLEALRISTMQNNIKINQLSYRAGLNQLTNGSRGTQN